MGIELGAACQGNRAPAVEDAPAEGGPGNRKHMYADMPVWFRELRDLAVLERNDRLLQLVLSVDSPPEDPNQMRWEFEGHN